MYQKSGLLFRKFAARFERFVVGAKPYADILLPLALVFFAYKADEVSRQQAEIQRTQASLQKLEAQPVFGVNFYDDGPKHEHAQVSVINYGGPTFDWPAYADVWLVFDAFPQKGGVFEEIFEYNVNYYGGYVSASGDFYYPIILNNMDHNNPNARVVSIKEHMQIADSYEALVQKVAIDGYKTSIHRIVVLHISWRNYAGVASSRIYVTDGFSSPEQVDVLPKPTGTVGLKVDDLVAAFRKTITDGHSSWRPE